MNIRIPEIAWCLECPFVLGLRTRILDPYVDVVFGPFLECLWARFHDFQHDPSGSQVPRAPKIL